jgi:hypothetical protein
MPRSDYEYEIEVRRLIPPIGKLDHYAKLAIFARRKAEGGVDHLPSPIGEVYGHSYSEAWSKARTAVEKWIDEQPGSGSGE